MFPITANLHPRNPRHPRLFPHAILYLLFSLVLAQSTAAQSEKTQEWTIPTLKEHFEALNEERDERNKQRFEAQEKAVNSALIAAKEAVTKAETAAEKRFDSVNEFRGQLKDQASTLMPRTETESRLNGLEDKIGSITTTVFTAVFLGIAVVTCVLLILRRPAATK